MSTTQGPPPTVGIDDAFGRSFAGVRHHRIPWSEGGPTDIHNGCLLCSFHHHLIHQGEWDLTLAPDGITEVIPPARIDLQRRRIRHQRFKPRPG
ncbi:MAG: HNH endonuclease signature motif containing protein [Nocardioidaceae bacterium]